MNVRFATQTETDEWDTKILSNPDGGNVFQGDEFAQQKKLTGWTPRYVLLDDLALTIHEKSVPILGKLWYAPKGPGVKTAAELTELLPDLQAFADRHGAFAVKIEPELPKAENESAMTDELGLVPVRAIQPNDSTVLIDLSPDLETVMAGLNQKGRHAIHRAERDGVSVKRVDATEENCQLFYALLAETAEHQGFSNSIRTYDYYRKFWQRYASANLGQLFFAYFKDEVVAGAFALVFGEKSTYKDGASRRVDGAYGVTHLVQWHVMEWAKEQGSLMHDLCGSPPSDQIENKEHPHYGIGIFKTSFNKHVTDYVGAYDLIVRPGRYKWWTKYGERYVKRAWWKKHHESWY